MEATRTCHSESHWTRLTESSSQPERIDLAQADDRRDVVHRAVACLAQGDLSVSRPKQFTVRPPAPSRPMPWADSARSRGLRNRSH